MLTSPPRYYKPHTGGCFWRVASDHSIMRSNNGSQWLRANVKYQELMESVASGAVREIQESELPNANQNPT